MKSIARMSAIYKLHGDEFECSFCARRFQTQTISKLYDKKITIAYLEKSNWMLVFA